MTQQRAYKFRIYPNITQKIKLAKTFGNVRYAWNSWVALFNNADIKDKQYKTAKQFRQEFTWMTNSSAATIQQKERDFFEFKKQFFSKKRKKHLGRPTFKAKHMRQSFRLPNQKFYILSNKIQLEKIGKVSITLDRQIKGILKNVTVSKDLCNNYYVSVLVEEAINYKTKTTKHVGIDVGLKEFATLSTGEMISNPRLFRKNQSKLKKLQQHFSRKKKSSVRRDKFKLRVAKLYNTISNQRDFFLHNLSTKIVTNFDIIAVEDLNISGMLKNHKLAKSIQDVSWAKFFNQLEYKSKWYGKELRKVGRFVPTSKTCNICGYYYKNLTLEIRDWICPDCGVKHDRDVNAAKNILKNSVGVNAEDNQTWRDSKTLEKLSSKASFDEVFRVP